MKASFIYLLLLILVSCNNEKFVDKRTNSQIKFISYVQKLRDSINSVNIDKAQRNLLLEKNIPAVKYIKDSLNLKIDNWQVKLIEKTDDYLYTGAVQLKLGIAFDPYDTRARAINQSIVLTAVIPPSDKSIIEAIKDLKIGDYLKVNGQFINKEGFIDIDSYSQYKFSKNVLDNPEFNASIKALEKL